MTARGRDGDGRAPDASYEWAGQWENAGTDGVGEGADGPFGRSSAADVGDARPVSLLGLRMPEQEGDSNATVSRRPGRPRRGLGRTEGPATPATRPPVPRPQAVARPSGGNSQSRTRAGMPSPLPGVFEPDPPSAAAPHPRASTPPGVPPAPAAGSGWTPDVATFLPGTGGVPTGSPETLSPDLTWPDVAWPDPDPDPDPPVVPATGSEPGRADRVRPASDGFVRLTDPHPVRPAGAVIRVAEPPASAARQVHVVGFADRCGRKTAAAGLEMALAASGSDRIAVDAGPDGRTLLPRAGLLVVATRAGMAELSVAHDALVALAGTGQGDIAARTVVAVMETVPARWSGRARRRLARLTGQACAVVVVPFDPVLAEGRPFTWSSLRRRTRAAFGELAAAVDAVGNAPERRRPSGGPTVRRPTDP